MSTPNFRFKQFTVWHDRCAMKVGTDGVLLGAWTPIMDEWRMADDQHIRVLDVGTGSGLVALMIAQRCPGAQIDAIDIDASAVEQAKGNFAASPWPERLQSCLCGLQECQINTIPSLERRGRERLYHLIVSNPPYFNNSLKNPDPGRLTARHTDSLGYDELLAHSARLLAPQGLLSLILPAETENGIIRLAATYGLSPTHITRVYSKVSKPALRVLISFHKSASGIQPARDTLTLENETGGRSAAYSQLCQEFYL